MKFSQLKDDYVHTLLGKYFRDFSFSRLSGGESAAELYKIRTEYNRSYILKRQKQSLESEYLNYKWLQNKVPVPEIIFYTHGDGQDFLCITEVHGKSLDLFIGSVEADAIVSSYARALKLLHSQKPDNKAIVCDLDKRISEAERNVKNNLVDPSHFQSENQQYEPYELFLQLKRSKPSSAELVFTHGDYCLDNLIYNEGKLSGFVDLGNGGVADKYQDLALAVRSILDNFTLDHVELFYREYGLQNIDKSKLEFYTLLDEFF